MDFDNAKPSFFIETQLPRIVKRDGEKFITFLEKYYDFLERNVVAITLKSDFDITNQEIDIGEIVGISYYPIITEDGFYLVSEDENIDEIFENNYSLKLNGVNSYLDHNGNLFNSNSNFSISGWIKLNEYPSIARQDFDIITLDHTEYFSLFKIFKNSNKFGYNIANTEVVSDIEIKKNQWNFFSIRYNNTSKELIYDIKRDNGEIYWSSNIDLSQTTSDRFVLGCDLYNSRNFSDIIIDEIAIHNSFLSNNEINSIYNNGTPINLLENYIDYTSNTNLQHWFRFEDQTPGIAQNTTNTTTTLNIFGNTSYEYDSSLNLKFIISEYLQTFDVELNVLGILKYEGVEDSIMSDRVIIFAEHLYGKLEKNIVIKQTENGPILISDFYEIKNCLYIINNLQKIQDIDYVFDYKNFISNVYFIDFWKEIMTGFPYFIHSKHEDSIKDVIAKNIQDFYKSKGTKNSFKLLFKILYNENFLKTTVEDEGLVTDTSITAEDEGLVTDTNITVEDEGSFFEENFISVSGYEYTIKTERYYDSNAYDYINNLCHPVGYKFNLISK